MGSFFTRVARRVRNFFQTRRKRRGGMSVRSSQREIEMGTLSQRSPTAAAPPKAKTPSPPPPSGIGFRRTKSAVNLSRGSQTRSMHKPPSHPNITQLEKSAIRRVNSEEFGGYTVKELRAMKQRKPGDYEEFLTGLQAEEVSRLRLLERLGYFGVGV